MLLDTLSINGHRGFYAFRHTFRTIADESKGQPAVNHVIWHSPHGCDMASVYRERIGDDRLKAVSDHVRCWLLAEAASCTKPGSMPFASSS